MKKIIMLLFAVATTFNMFAHLAFGVPGEETRPRMSGSKRTCLKAGPFLFLTEHRSIPLNNQKL